MKKKSEVFIKELFAPTTMAVTTYIETSQLLNLGLSNPSETRTTPSTAPCRSPVAFFNPNACVLTGSVAIVVEKLSTKVRSARPERKTFEGSILVRQKCSLDFSERFRHLRILFRAVELTNQLEQFRLH